MLWHERLNGLTLIAAVHCSSRGFPRFRVPYASSFNDTQSAFPNTRRDIRQASTTSRDIIPASERPSNVNPVEKEIGMCRETRTFEAVTPMAEPDVPTERCYGKMPEWGCSKERGSGTFPAQGSAAVAKEHDQPSGYSRRAFYFNLVDALTEKLEGRSSSTH